MTDTARVNTTLTRALVERIDAFAAARFEDRSTAVRQLVALALRELAKREAIEAYEQGRVTLREFGRTLGLDVWRAQDLLLAEGVGVSQGARSETANALDAAVASRRSRDASVAREL